MLFHAILIASALFLSLGATAISPTDDPKCPQGAYPGFETNVWQFNTPAVEFINKTGSFFHAEWYTGPLNSTHGKDNIVGSTRTGTIGSFQYTEELVGHYRSPTHSDIRFSLRGNPLPLDGFKLVSYTEDIRITSICGGTATHFSMTATYCTDKVNEAYAFYDEYRRNTVGAVAKELNALVFSGTCPIGGN